MPIDPSKPFDLRYRVDPTWADMRLDRYVKAMVPAMSRTRIQKYVRDERVEVNGEARPANWRVRLGDEVVLRCRAPAGANETARRIPLAILYEDEDVVAIDKQPGLVVHPVALHRHDTLLNALYWRYKETLPAEQEVSLANRLDRYTSGVILVAKHTASKQALQPQFERRTTRKVYRALCEGLVHEDAGVIDLPIGPGEGTDRCKMAIRDTGKPSRTSFRVLERFAAAAGRPEFTLVELEPHTGRQHQLRLHLAATGHPLVCDDRYGDPRGLLVTTGGDEHALARYALHAAALTFAHPASGEPTTVTAPLASDLAGVAEGLRAGGTPRREALPPPELLPA